MSLAPGATLGRYQILELVGSGGMASVYKAFQPKLERVVALKVLRADASSDLEFKERFLREGQAVARLRHPNIVQVFDFDEVDGRAFMAMEYLEGGTLKQHVSALADQGQRVAPREVARFVTEVADALDAAHAQGIVHRDIKPSNVLLTRDGKAVVGDFGIARILAALQQTETGVGMGTPEYMSPEQGQGLAVDARSDIYSLGVLAYELLVGRVPFRADTPLATVLAHVRDPLPLPSRISPQVGAETERVLVTALAKSPLQRYQRASLLAHALERALTQDQQITGPTVLPGILASPARSRFASPVTVILGALGALALVGGAAAMAGSVRTTNQALTALVTATPQPSATSTRTAPSGAGASATGSVISAAPFPSSSPSTFTQIFGPVATIVPGVTLAITRLEPAASYTSDLRATFKINNARTTEFWPRFEPSDVTMTESDGRRHRFHYFYSGGSGPMPPGSSMVFDIDFDGGGVSPATTSVQIAFGVISGAAGPTVGWVLP